MTYHCPLIYRNADLNTIFPNMFRPLPKVEYVRERLELPDGDFLDLDWSKVGSNRLAYILHGLESSSNSFHVKGMAHQMNEQGWDVLALNYRGCSGEPNRKVISYHAGKTDDVLWVLNKVKAGYNQIGIIGFSLGGNLALVAAGRERDYLPSEVIGIASISAPCDLADSSAMWSKRKNNLYLFRFLWDLKAKIRQKAEQFEEFDLTEEQIKSIKSFKAFDDFYTAPVHGFRDAADYYANSSSAQYLDYIELPTIILNALDDPFLSDACYPHTKAEANPNIQLYTPKYGGHIGFAERLDLTSFWHERMVVDFFKEF